MFSGPNFVVGIVAVCMGAWVITTFIRARYGYPLTDDWGNRVDKSTVEDDRKIALLAQENGELTSRLLRLEERIAVLERIATDKATRLSEEIERLR